MSTKKVTIYSLDEIEAKYETKSAVCLKLGKPNQRWREWIGRKLVLEDSSGNLTLVNDEEFWRG